MALSASEALARLKAGNERFVALERNEGDVGQQRRAQLATEGQQPYAVVIACSDSRVVPEHLFNCGLGELFTIRTAGNTVGASETGSVVYACGHLGCRLVVLMGHTCCGAVEATLEGGDHGAANVLTDAIAAAIGDERDPYRASVLNVEAGLTALAAEPGLAALLDDGLVLQGAIHHIDSGRVEFL